MRFIARSICSSSTARICDASGLEGIIAGRSPLRLATLSLPTHREVVAAALRISALGAPQFKRAPRLPCVPCCVSAFHAAAIRLLRSKNWTSLRQ
jgi:hypothetical protein